MKLAGLAADANLQPCSDASGFSMLPPTGMPNATQQQEMCNTPSCHALIADIIALNPSNCILDFSLIGMGNIKMNVYELSHNFEPTCAGPITTAPATTAPVTTVPTTTAPGTTTPATTAPVTKVPVTTVPGTTTPATTAPVTKVPATTVPGTTVPGKTDIPTGTPEPTHPHC